MDISDLTLFVRIARLGSISAAARDLNVTPTGASARLAALEKRLGARLLHRTTRQATLTEDGIAFLPHAEHVLDAALAARAALGREQATPRGTLRVAAPASFARMHIVPGLSEFCNRYPELVLDMRISDSVVDLVEGAFDVAVATQSLGTRLSLHGDLRPTGVCCSHRRTTSRGVVDHGRRTALPITPASSSALSTSGRSRGRTEGP
ncbi:LysR family transcriptional regulator [Belnapia sp. T18]|uniref:LysR family transcriptional regulator n=1 Tax=Belnapia arida TaxID=2804533 RepID=A0ABS1UC90_9PROT|nr:LysR family transcriptional regulator [Belnapia arida]MBL6081775.1 LysR family transcriptional regulator [Belnapia arida]